MDASWLLLNLSDLSFPCGKIMTYLFWTPQPESCIQSMLPS